MARKQWLSLLVIVSIVVSLIYYVMREEIRQTRRVSHMKSYSIEDAIREDLTSDVRLKRNGDDIDTVTKEQNKELYKRLARSRHDANTLQLKINELNTIIMLKKREELGLMSTAAKKSNNKQAGSKVRTVYIVTPTYKRFMQKAELTRVSQALKGVADIHWIVVEDARHKTELVQQFLERSGLQYTHLNIKTPDLLRRGEGENRRFKPRGVFQRNLGIQWIRNNVDPKTTPGVVYFADDDNTYDSRIFEEIRRVNAVGVWPVAFTGAARWAGPICRQGKVIGFHTNWGKFRPFPIDMAGFAINIKKLIVDYPRAVFKAMKKPGMLESSLLKQITSKKKLEPMVNGCTKIYVWHTRSQKPRDSIIGERELIRRGRPSDPEIQS